ncbi:hypothetical protein FRUB_10000 [Fimbriiglobus ruber]|uniref:Uncharacterized protein n=1 Tax=Fimbriiglobus ruber TaxID=1908690 RepID=A0A225D9D7_9BACT|nr:hypothetical protein FRUB_10000 [Fimbriiglobus ruber]
MAAEKDKPDVHVKTPRVDVDVDGKGKGVNVEVQRKAPHQE